MSEGTLSAVETADDQRLTSDPTPAPPPSGARRKLGREAFIYGFGMIMRRAATVIMIPVYTRLLTTTDFGLLTMLDRAVEIAGILVSAGMTAGVMRFYFKAQTQRERHEVVASATLLVLVLNLLGAALLVAAAGPIHHYVLEEAGPRYLIYIAAANFALNEVLTMPMLLMQMEGRAALYSAAAVVRLTMQLSLNILLLVGFGWGPRGILVSTLITNVVVGGAALVWMFRRIEFRTSRAALRDLRRFGVPYQLATAATFVLQFGDRFFIEGYRGLAAVGVYSFAYNFGFMLDQLGAQPFMRAWQPRRFERAHAPRAERERADNDGLHALTLIVVTLALGVALFVKPALRIVASPQSGYLASAGIVPLVVAAFVMQSWGGVLQFGIDAAERTKYSTYVMWISAALILGLYAVLIPPFGVYGAGVATLVAFIARTLLMSHFSQQVWPQRYDWAPQFKILGFAAVATILAWVIPALVPLTDGFVGESALGVALFAMYAAAVWTFAISEAHRLALKARVRGVAVAARRLVPA